MSSDVVSRIQNRYKQITKRSNIEYYGSTSETANSFYVGSYGRGTEIWTSDIDMILVLPYSLYKRYNDYTGNGQSALLQNVKIALQKTYSTSHIKGDGQVIGVNFSDGISFEIVPAFLNENGSYTYPDSNNGGKWKVTDPKKEIQAMDAQNTDTNKNLKRLCRMARSWKGNCKVDMSGILIDTLAYKFISDWEFKDKSYLYYDFMSRDFFKYLKELDKEQTSWLAPGSNKMVMGKSFQSKASKAYDIAIEAIEAQSNGNVYTSKKKWREIYGSRIT